MLWCWNKVALGYGIKQNEQNICILNEKNPMQMIVTGKILGGLSSEHDWHKDNIFLI